MNEETQLKLSKKEKDFYSNIIFRDNKYVELRFFKPKEKGTAVWFKFVESVYDIEGYLNKHKSDDVTVYVGCNSRNVMGAKDSDIDNINMMFYDIEAEGIKPKLTDENYITRLQKVLNHIINHNKEKYGMSPSAVQTSGRGMYLIYLLKPLNEIEFKEAFECFFKSSITSIKKYIIDKEKNLVQKDDNYNNELIIKFDDAMFNASRVFGALGGVHKKYDEKPFRELLYIDSTKISDISLFLNNIKTSKIENKIPNKKKTKRINNKRYEIGSIWDLPELKFLLDYSDDELPKGELYKKVWLPIKLKCRELGTHDDVKREVEKEVSEAGHTRAPINDEQISEDYEYSHFIFLNWCYSNYKWCNDNNYKVPYCFNYYHFNFENTDLLTIKESEDTPLITMKDVIKFSKNFCINNWEVYGIKTCININLLKDSIIKNCKDKDLIKFIDYQDWWLKLCMFK